MLDLFHFLKDLIRNEPEVPAAFFMGVLVATVFLSYVIFWIVGKIYGKKTSMLASEARKACAKVKDAERERDQHKDEAKTRKAKLDDAEERLKHLEAEARQAKQDAEAMKADAEQAKQVAAASQKEIAQWKTQHDRLYKRAHGKLKAFIEQSTSYKKQIEALTDQARSDERMYAQLWDVPADKTTLTPFRPLKKHTPMIVAVTNLKGGVGKTTLTANLAATYCRQLDRRVLVVDLDFQASLTNLCLSTEGVAELGVGNGRLVDNMFKEITGDLASLAFSNVVQTREPKLHLLAASENLANLEERSKARWLMKPGGLDLRCVLRSALHHAIFQDTFDVILIDCPPRWTTSSINAIACCDFVLIPTQLDRLASEAVPRLLAWLRDLRASSRELYGNFEVLGVLGNLAFPRATLIAQERTIWEALPEKCLKAWGLPVHAFEVTIKDKSEFRRAANNREFAALHPDLNPSFLELVQEIEAQRCAHVEGC